MPKNVRWSRLAVQRTEKRWFSALIQKCDRFDGFTRHFLFGFRLEPIQARNISYSNNLRLPRV